MSSAQGRALRRLKAYSSHVVPVVGTPCRGGSSALGWRRQGLQCATFSHARSEVGLGRNSLRPAPYRPKRTAHPVQMPVQTQLDTPRREWLRDPFVGWVCAVSRGKEMWSRAEDG